MARPDSSEGGQMNTTEQLVSAVFCDCAFRHNNPQTKCPYSLCDRFDYRKYAKFARRFVRLEHREMSVDKLDDEIQRLMHLANSKERKRK
jgi:hypothetical protein